VPRRRRIAVAIIGVVIALAVIGAGAFLWYAPPVPLLPEATAALASTDAVEYTVGADGTLLYTPTASEPTVGLVLYPGGKVPPAAYAPAARAIAEAGFLVAIVDVPFNLAVFDINAAQAVIDANPQIERWAVGGHSLGGSMAAQFVDGHRGIVDGLVLWASYSAADLSGEGLRVLSSYGTLDHGVASFTSPDAVAKLGGPDAVAFDPIEGGNHEQMGWYTGQPNDPPATISREAQQERIVVATRQLLGEIASGPP
jgi:dienelactone hydrolase